MQNIRLPMSTTPNILINNFVGNRSNEPFHEILLLNTCYTRQRSAVGNVSDYRCVTDNNPC